MQDYPSLVCFAPSGAWELKAVLFKRSCSVWLKIKADLVTQLESCGKEI